MVSTVVTGRKEKAAGAAQVPAASAPSDARSRGMRAGGVSVQKGRRVALGGLRLLDIAMLASSGARFAERDLWNVARPVKLIPA